MWIYFFSAPRCSYCVEPKELVNEYRQKHPLIPVKEFNIDEDYELWDKFKLKKIPSLVMIDDKGEIHKYQGKKACMDGIDKLHHITDVNFTIEF